MACQKRFSVGKAEARMSVFLIFTTFFFKVKKSSIKIKNKSISRQSRMLGAYYFVSLFFLEVSRML